MTTEPPHCLPGTVLPLSSDDPSEAMRTLDVLFLGGGPVLSQVAALIDMEPYSVQNWVRRGFVSPPVAKKYSKKQVCRLILIHLLKEVMEIGDITAVFSYINGALDDESDDTVDDDRLYFYFVSLLAKMKDGTPEEIQCLAADVTSDYREPIPGAAARLREVLTILAYAYRSSQWKKQTDALVASCLKK